MSNHQLLAASDSAVNARALSHKKKTPSRGTYEQVRVPLPPFSFLPLSSSHHASAYGAQKRQRKFVRLFATRSGFPAIMNQQDFAGFCFVIFSLLPISNLCTPPSPSARLTSCVSGVPLRGVCCPILYYYSTFFLVDCRNDELDLDDGTSYETTFFSFGWAHRTRRPPITHSARKDHPSLGLPPPLLPVCWRLFSVSLLNPTAQDCVLLRRGSLGTMCK